jgi:hypothetical protein
MLPINLDVPKVVLPVGDPINPLPLRPLVPFA